MLKKYKANQKTKKQETKSSGVACDEKGCKGEMMIKIPEETHPQLGLKRAVCNECGWLGWV